MYAVIKTGAKQYKVATGDVIDVELLDAELGSRVEFSDVLFYSNGTEMHVGAPHVAGVTVVGEIVDFSAGPKVMSIKYKPSHHQYRKFGHRQKYSRVKISIEAAAEKHSTHKKHHKEAK